MHTTLLRTTLMVCFVASLSACSSNPGAPTSGSGGATTNLAGAWNGTIASSNNANVPIKMGLTQSGSNVNGDWSSTSIAWSGQFSGAVSGSSFDGQLKFSGTAFDGTVCTGTANVAGPVSASTMTLTSASGVVGGACPAPLPVGIRIELQHE